MFFLGDSMVPVTVEMLLSIKTDILFLSKFRFHCVKSQISGISEVRLYLYEMFTDLAMKVGEGGLWQITRGISEMKFPCKQKQAG